MNWIGTEHLRRADAIELKAGTLIFDPSMDRSLQSCVAIRVDGAKLSDGSLKPWLLVLSDWNEDWRLGDLVEAGNFGDVLAVSDKLAIELELAPDAPPASFQGKIKDGGGILSWNDKGLRILGVFMRSSVAGRQTAEIDPKTWAVATRRTDSGPTHQLKAWRLRLRLNERESVCFGPGAPSTGG